MKKQLDMVNPKRIQFLISCFALIAFLSACNDANEEDLSSLEKKRSEVKAELLELEEKIRTLDTTKTIVFPLVETGAVSVGTFKHKINVQGNVETDKDALINAEISGLIRSINVREGEKVTKGQTIAVIDAEILASNIEEVKSQLEFATYALEKQEQLQERGLGTEFEYRQAKNQVNALRSQLETLATQKGKSIVTAPFSGLVDQIFPKEGEITSPQSPLVRLVNNEQVKVVSDISERHYKSISVGTPVQAYVPTLSDTFELTVSNVGNYIHPTNRTFRVQAKIDKNERLLPNMLVQLQITDLILDSAIVIPSESILKSQQNEDYIFVLHESEKGYAIEQLYVEVLSKFNGRSAVISSPRGLKEGELVVTRGGRGITVNDIVKIR